VASRQDRWNKAVQTLLTLQEEFQDALDNLEEKETLTDAQEEMVELLTTICIDHDVESMLV
jgi:DNA-binding transcriptional regulator GbsR (MarR family)